MNDLIQTSFDYGVLTQEQAQRTQDAEVRIIGRTQRTIVENGRDLLAVKKDIGHGRFLDWIRFLGISESTAESWMNVAAKFGDIPDSRDFETRALYLLSTSKVPETALEEAKERAASGEKITEEIAKQIRDAHKAKDQAEEEARQAQTAASLAQQKLFDEQSKAQTRSKELNQQIQELAEKIETLSKPKEVIKEVDKPATIAQMEKLRSEVKALTVQRDNLSRLTEELSADLDANEAKREEEARILRVRQEWQKNTDAMYKNVIRFLGQLPMPLDTRIFESDDWDMLDQVMESFQRGIEECRNVRGNISHMIIEAR